MSNDIEQIAEGPCPHCDDSGFTETYRGGIWTGQNMSSSLQICDCICGQDVRRERAPSVSHPTPGGSHG